MVNFFFVVLILFSLAGAAYLSMNDIKERLGELRDGNKHT